MPTDPPRFFNLEDTNGSGRFDEGDDLKPGIKQTLGDYLSELTKTSPNENKYTIAPGSSEHVTFTDDNGKPSPLVTGQGSGETVFIDDVAQAARSYFETLSNSGQFDSAEPSAKGLIDIINKRMQEDGHELLSTIEGTPLDSSGQNVVPGEPKTLVEEKIAGVLLNNRFNPGPNTPYIQDGEFSESFGQKQDKFGVYEENAKVAYEIEDLTKIACSLLLKASGRLSADEDPSEYDAGNILTVGKGSGGSLGPLSTVRIGTKKVGVGELYAANAYGGERLTSQGLRDAELIETAGPDGERARADGFNVPGTSFGQMWSHLEQFAPVGAASPSPIALLLPQFAVIITLAVVLTLLSGLISGATDNEPNPENPDALQKGRFKSEYSGLLNLAGNSVKEKLGITRTSNNYVTSVFVGFLWFSAAATWGGAGFVTSVQRSVARDAVDFGSGIGEKFSGGLVSDILGLSSLVFDLARSKPFKFIQVMATMGDKLLLQWQNNIDKPGFNTNTTFVTKVGVGANRRNIEVAGNKDTEKITEAPSTRHVKSRAGEGGDENNFSKNDLVWRNSATRSSYLYPTRLAGTLQKYYGKFELSNRQNVAIKRDMATAQIPTNRLSPDSVREIEDELEGEYVPFYFHDLRTNEIISFHAFLTNIADAYSPKWNAVDGVGRIEPVQIYESTDRKISLEFFAVSTSDGDFESMWYKINKLVTLVYPQWSKGRFIEDGNNKFTQPFSQVKTASPLVRIRLGDLFKSNYSKFALARLFGVTDEKFTVEGGLTGVSPAENLESKLADYLKGTDLAQFFASLFKASGSEIVVPKGTYPVVGAENINEYKVRSRVVGIVKGSPMIVVKNKDQSSRFLANSILVTNPATRGERAELELPETETTYNVDIEIKDGNATKTLTIKVQNDALEPSKDEYLSFIPQVPVILPDPFREALQEFLNPENNAIVRSFESSRGRGLAGAITSMDFNWQDMMWETDRPGVKAPKMCKISIQFTPIHDIQPGIDSDGFNRAPIYNVGNIVNGFGGDPYDEK